MMAQHANDIIGIEQLKIAIENSGYLVEQRVEQVFSKHDYDVSKNEVYKDDETNKSREIDLTAFIGYPLGEKDDDIFVSFRFLVECENNRQPVVFFRSDSPLKFTFPDDIKISGIPLAVTTKKGYRKHLLELINLDDFHHYGKGFYSTQYCSFQPVKNDGKWIACHPDLQHASFVSLLKSVKHFILEDHDSYYLSKAEEPVGLFFYYPLIVLQGELMECFYNGNEMKVEPRNHIQFRKQDFNGAQLETYQFDIVQENHLPVFLKAMKREQRRIVKVLSIKKKTLNSSAKQIAKAVRKAKTHVEAREILGGDI